MKKDLVIFFLPSLQKDEITLSESDSKHAIKVLRLKINDWVHLTNGKGLLVKGKIVDDNTKNTKVKIAEKKQHTKPKTLALAFCPTKNHDRNTWIIEKATEIGVTEFYPIYSQNSERRKWNEDKAIKTTISAIKQSHNLWLPKMHPFMKFESFLELKLIFDKKFMAHCRDDKKSELNQVCNKNSSQIILIGPEGDFTQNEINYAKKKLFKMISLGENRLRTETACISAISIMKI